MRYWMDEEKRFKQLINILRDPMYKGKKLDLHTHDFVEIEYVISGQGTQMINDKNYDVSRGDVIYLKKGDCHTYWTNEHLEILNVVFYYPVFDEVKGLLKMYNTDEEVDFPTIMHLNSQDMLFIEDLLLKAEREFDEEKPGYYHALKSYLIILMIHLQRTMCETKNTSNYRIPIILEYIDRHFDNVSVPQVAEHFGYSTNYFSKYFKKETGMYFTEYVNRMRVNKAIELLAGTEEPIDSISADLGFNDKKHFYEVFKKYVGITPGMMRKHKKK